MDKFVEVDGQKFVDDGTGRPKVGEDGQPIKFVEQSVPYNRFKEVNDKKNELEARIAELEGKKNDGGLTAEQQKELQAKQVLAKMFDEHLANREKTAKEAEAREQREFEEQVKNELAANTEVKRAEFVKFLEDNGDDFSTVASAMKFYKTLDAAQKEAYNKAKGELTGKPALPKHEGGKGEVDYREEDKGKSLWEIAHNAIAGQGKK